MAIGSQDLRFRVLLSVIGSNAVKGLADNIQNLSKKADLLGSATKLFGTYLAVDTIKNFGKSIIDTADNFNDLSQKTGVAVETLAAFDGQAQQSGVSTEQLAKGLAKLSVNMVAAANGNKVLLGTFQTLGVSVKNADGTLKNAGQVTKDIADKFAKLKDGPEKAAIAVKLFGKSGQELIPFLNEGSAALEKFGLNIDQDFASRADAFNDTISQIGKTVKNDAIGALKELLPTFQEIASGFLNFAKGSEDVPGVMDAIGEAARIMSLGVITAFDGTRQALDQIVTFFRKAKAQIQLDFATVKKLDEEYDKRQAKAGANYFKTIDSIRKNSLIFGDGTAEQIKERQRKETTPALKRGTKTPDISGLDENRGEDKIKEFIAQQRLENDQRRDALNDINLTAVEQKKLNEERKFELEVLKVSKGLNEEQTAELKRQAAAVMETRQALIDLEEQQKETWSVGAKQALKEYAETARDVAAQTKNVFQIAFRDMEDAITNFVKGGKLDFKKFADDIITEVIRIQVRMLIAQAATGAAGLFSGFFSSGASTTTTQATTVSGGTITNAAFASGGIMTSRGRANLKAYAGGGIANSPQIAMFGEGSRPEAYVPLPDGKTIPVTMKGGAGGGDVNVNVNVSVEKGEASVQSNSDQGADFGRMIGTAIKAVIIQEKRPGGLLA